jgi:hypothetical protein
MTEAIEKERLIKEAFEIIDILSKSDLGDVDYDFTADDFDYQRLQELITQAKELVIEAKKFKEKYWHLF